MVAWATQRNSGARQRGRMLMRGLILPVALAVVLLSGCGKNEQSASQSERASSSSLPAAGDSAPSVQLKPGLWESSFEVEDIAFTGIDRKSTRLNPLHKFSSRL